MAKRIIKNVCRDCGLRITSGHKRCRSCYDKSRIGEVSRNKGNTGYKKNISEETRNKLRLLLTGKNNPRWKGGRALTGHGYVSIRNTAHPFNVNGYVLEHRLVMEEKLGRYLHPNELVHHRNGIKDDNRVENLIIVYRDSHRGLVVCPYCGEEFFIR